MYKAYLNRSKSRNIPKYRHQEKLTSVINKKTFRNHLNKFIGEYNILSENPSPLLIAKHAVKALFWAVVYLAFGYLTTTWTYELIQRYRNDEVTTNMKAVINNNVIYFPNMTICFKINVKELFNIHSSSYVNYTSAWSRFFEETVSPEGIFKVKKRQVYDDEIYLSLLKYLAMIYEAERAWEPGLTQISTFNSEESDDWIALKKVLVPNIERFNITLEQLKSVFGEKLCSLPVGYPYNHLLDLVQEPSKKTECVAGSKISFIGLNTICFRLIGYQSHLQQLGTAEYIDLYQYDDYKDQKWCQEFTIDLGSESRSTPRRATTRNETYGYYYNRFPSKFSIYLDIGIKALYRKLPYVNGEIQCSSDTSREECENKCFRGWIRTNCRCSPITFSFAADISHYRNCTVDDYSICLKKYSENATYLCADSCMPLCEQWHYEYNLQPMKDDFSYIQMSPITFDYVIIEQVFTWNSFEDFIGALGGALGIWLGLDFVIITELIVKLVTRLVKMTLLRKAHNTEEDKHRKGDNIKHEGKVAENGKSSSTEVGSRVVGHKNKFKENERKVVGTSIRQISESEEHGISSKKRERNSLKDKHVQQWRKRLNHNRADNVILNDNMKNTDKHGRRLRNQKLNTAENVDGVQDEPTPHTNNSSARNWFLQKMIVLFLNGSASTSESAVFLQLVEKLSWAAIYLFGSVFTTIWCVEAINLYLADETVYYPSLIVNRTVSLPPPALCILNGKKLLFERQGKISNALLDYFGQSDINRTSFTQISDGIAWPEQLVSIGLLYLSILAASEINHHDTNFISKYKNRLHASAGKDTVLRADIKKSINDILLPKLLHWNVSANELRQKLGAELARMIELKISFTNSNGTTDIVNKTSFYTAAITDEIFCYSLSNEVTFIDSDDVLEFSISRALYPEFLEQWKSYMVLSDYILEPNSAQFNIDDNVHVAVFDSTYFFFEYGYITRALISVDGIYTSRPAKKSGEFCTRSTAKLYCRAECRIKLIEKLCNCSPTYWAMMIQPTSGLDECTFDRYMRCLNFNANDDRNCKNSCLPICTAKYLRSDLTWNDLSLFPDSAVFKLSVKDGMYMSIEEKPIISFNDLLIKV